MGRSSLAYYSKGEVFEMISGRSMEESIELLVNYELKKLRKPKDELLGLKLITLDYDSINQLNYI